MAKKILCVVMTVVFLLSSVIVAPATADDTTALDNGFTNVIFSNEYRGFCLDRYKRGAYIGDVFTPTDTSKATNNINNGDISQKLKILFTQCFNDLFVYNETLGYVIRDKIGDNEVTESVIQDVIYHFVGEQDYLWAMRSTLQKKVNAYTGTAIPDNGYTLTLDNGDTVTFYFLVMQANKDNQQDFFAYKIVTNEKPTHKCEFPEQWESDEDSHWHECECGEKADEKEHSGGEATCLNKAVCEKCQTPYGELNPENHVGDTYVKDAVEPSYEAPGYTGDTYCSDCNELLEEGKPIDQLHKCEFSDEWKYDEDSHWHECECGERSGEKEHSGGEATCTEKAVCEDCGQPYGDENPDNHSFSDEWESDEDLHWHECICGATTDEDEHSGGEATCTEQAKCEECGESYGKLNPENHVGDTYVKDAVKPSYEAPGYTGDTYCADCDELLEEGKPIDQLHKCEFSDEWKYDEDSHWHECECGERSGEKEHSGGEATCTEKAVCEDCGQPYGDENPDNHSFSDEWESDEDSHWHECICGATTDEDEHSGGEATCIEKAVCEICNSAYGDVDSKNHTGDVYVVGAKEPTYEEPGYTGDIYCTDCNEPLEEGKPIDQLHKCEFSDEWKYDEDLHWHECECGEKSGEKEHSGGEATCTEKAVCEDCGQPYGDENPDNHSFSDEWESDEDLHWHECICGATTDEDEHSGGEATCIEKAVCEICNSAYGDVDSKNHTGDVYVVGAKEPTYEEPGYTGDIYCADCNELLEEGKPIDQLHSHDFSELEHDEDSHWHECECGEISEKSEHSGGEATCLNKAVCEKCQTPYGELNPENHVGDTYVKDAVEPSYEAPGYTGDTYCSDCNELLEEGKPIDQLHKCEFSDEWKYDEDSHWHECECGERSGEKEHSGGEATCTEKAVCEDCGQPYGDENPDNHSFSDEWESDEDSHWHECECGEKADEKEHSGGEATCLNKAVCEKCQTPYGELNPENHVGDTYVKDAVEPSYEAPGYTGDTYCADCDELLEEGKPIDQLHSHDFSELEHDEDSHWYECECGEKSEKVEHVFVNGSCTECEVEDPEYVAPSVPPSETPTATPTATPTVTPTEKPTQEPTATPTLKPTPTPPADDNTNPETGENIMIYLCFMISFVIVGAVVFKRKSVNPK